jgi:(1->4)-alpha-D-glucan 1-alpha-D-glucosylmutase
MRTPRSTYRLQVTPEFDLLDAARRLPYLHDLGVDWVYLSPVLQATEGSSHGYDVVAPSRVDRSRGGSSGLAALSAQAHRLGMGVLVDIVPNHMGVGVPEQNPWWWDVLRQGRASPYAEAFDIDWDAFGGQVMVPVVGEDDLLPDGGVANLHVDGDRLLYHDTAYPLAPHYRLVSWRRGDAELNYRRFFTITTLAGVRVEEPWVFTESHQEIERWFGEGLVDGLRIDHPDGLRDPAGYLDDLARLTGGAYVLVEKILEPGEDLPRSWATAGTTGYDALGFIDRVLIDPAGQDPLEAIESRVRGGPVDWASLTHDTRRAVTDRSLLAEVRRIVREVEGSRGLVTGASAPSSTSGPPLVKEVAQQPSRSQRDLEDAVAEILACFPVYRSYLPEGRDHLDQAFAAARSRRPDLAAALDALEPVLTDPAHPAALRFQQTSGMVMAKGVEDCAFYRYSRLTSLNVRGRARGLPRGHGRPAA